MGACLTGCRSSRTGAPAAAGDELRDFQRRAAAYHSIISIPEFETTTNQIRQTLATTIAEGNAALDGIGRLKPGEVAFDNTARALDDMGFHLGLAANRLSLIEETSTNAEVRDAATEALKELSRWMVGIDYREDVYRAIKAYADRKPKLEGEDAKLLVETMRDYRRAGLELAQGRAR